jgi:hypothetical protein
VFAATRVHIELYRTTLEDRGLAPTTIDRRLSTVRGEFGAFLCAMTGDARIAIDTLPRSWSPLSLE